MPRIPASQRPGEPYDFRASFAVVNITSVDTGKTATFSAVKGAEADEHLPFFSNMTVKEDISTHGEINVTLTPHSYQDALDLLKSPWMKIGNTVGVRWGYTRHKSHSSAWHYGMLLQPDISFGDQFSVTVKASSFGFLASRGTTGRVWSSKVAQGGAKFTPFEVIKAIAKRYDFEINLNDGETLSRDPKFLLLDKKDTIIQTANDYMFMKHLAIWSGCRLFITRGNTINIIDRKKARKPEHTFIYRGPFDLEKNIFPIDTFDSETTAMFLPTRGVAQDYLSPYAKGSTLAQKWNANAETAPSAAYSGGQVPKPDPQVGKVSPPNANAKKKDKIPSVSKFDPATGAPEYLPVVLRDEPGKGKTKALSNELKAVANGIFRQRADYHGVTATVSGPDVPALLPEDMIQMKGVGEYYSVPYRLHAILHTIGEDFATHESTLMPRGFPGNMANQLAVSAKDRADAHHGSLSWNEVLYD